MLTRFIRAACLVLMVAVNAPAKADDLADFNAATEAAAVHYRTAIGYLRTGNADLASLEIDRLRQEWSQLVQRFSGHRPKVFEGNNLYSKTLVGISARLVGVDLMLKTGRLDNAREGLEAVRGDLYALRKSAGVVVLADCIYDSNKAAAVFLAYDAPGLDWNKSGQAVADKAMAYSNILTRCNGLASKALQKDPEFRRLIDEAQTELAKVKQAAKKHDSAQLHRIGGSLRAVNNLLAFRFG
jgi:hypothetical protein